MNLHAAVRGAIPAVNPDIPATWRSSTGYTVDANFNQQPTYATAAVTVQVQALTGRDLEHVNNLNIQGVLRAVYLFGNAQGVVRPDAKGGDLLTFPQVPGGTPQVWLVVAVLETWPDWCKVAVVLQTDVTT